MNEDETPELICAWLRNYVLGFTAELALNLKKSTWIFKEKNIRQKRGRRNGGNSCSPFHNSLHQGRLQELHLCKKIHFEICRRERIARKTSCRGAHKISETFFYTTIN